MPEELVVRQCAPTLAGIKTGSLFRAAYEDKKQLLGQIREINQRLHEKGLCLLPLRFRNGNALLYLYRPERLKTDLNNELARGLESGTPCRGRGESGMISIRKE